MINQFSAILSALTGPVALFSDFDGTLVEIAPQPDAIEVPDHLADRLRSVDRALDGAFAIISGRTISDIDSFLGAGTFSISGSHGAECRHDGDIDQPPSNLTSTAAQIENLLSGHFDNDDRILVERKPACVAVHFRAAPDRADDVRDAMADAISQTDGFRSIEGKKVIEAKPEGVDKGEAISRLMRLSPFKGRMPIFIGDDVTDEDGFRAVNAIGGISIKVGDGRTEARFRVPDVASVRDLVTLIAEPARRRPHTSNVQEAFK